MGDEDGDEIGRALGLLWGRVEPPSRGPKPSLSLGEIVRAGIAIADEEGLSALSMRRVADRLGFTTMSLYRHVPGKAELVEVMLDTAIGEPPAPDPAAGWRAEMTRWARANFELHHRHHWLLEVAIRHPPVGPRQLRWLDAALQALSRLGLEDREMLAAVLLVEHYVRGAAQIIIGLKQTEARSRASASEEGLAYERILQSVVTEERYPALARLVASGAFAQGDEDLDDFAFGLSCVLDGIEALVARRRSELKAL